MARFIHYRCPDCDRVFRHLHHPSDAPPPDRCPLCGAWVSGEEPPQPVFVPQAPLIRENAYAKSIDSVFRANEAASIERANEAAGQLEDLYRVQAKDEFQNVTEEFQRSAVASLKSNLKITDMKDPSSMREGDVAAVAPTPPSLREGGSIARFQNLGGAVPNHQPGVGPEHLGTATAEAISGPLGSHHRARAEALARQGQIAPSYGQRQIAPSYGQPYRKVGVSSP